jgi:hypothetical protein
MASLSRVTFAALVRGSIASLISTLALAGLAKLDGKAFAQATNSTSHWLNGRTAAHPKESRYKTHPGRLSNASRVRRILGTSI